MPTIYEAKTMALVSKLLYLSHWKEATTFRSSAEYTKSKFGGNWFPFIIDGSKRSDYVRTFSVGIGNRNLRLFGFSPKLTLTAINKSSNVQNYGFDKNRAEFAFVRYY